ncbi:MAG: pentapeptide repeat-containing protein [Gammaproteobacteria bacterium]|nr:pentapeptide repeat-containing protein [Gammaproteobacteria bacterium]
MASTYNEDPLYRLLHEGEIDEFNRRRRAGERCDLRASELSGLDLRKLDANDMDLRDCCLHQSDLRGVDFSRANLAGCSINGAKISGTLFPAELGAEEITLSLLHGTRMRYRR